jgi:hypothetical protein
MSISSKAFVVTGKENLVEVMNTVVDSINKWQRSKLDSHIETTEYINRMNFIHRDDNKKDWSNGCSIHAYNMDCISIDFRVNGESRSLKALPDCSCDTQRIHEGNSIVFSINKWGMSEEIMAVVIAAIKAYGPTYYDFDDCDDEDYVLIDD